jgi:uncharacterized damage-inducible protein DinB
MEKPLYDLPTIPGMHPAYGQMASMLADATREWREYLERVEPAALVYQPFAGGHSMGAVMLHMADVEAYWIEKFLLGMDRDPGELAEFLSEETKQDEVDWPTPPLAPLSYYFGLQDGVRKRTLENLARLPDPDWQKERSDYVATAGWVVNHVIGHESYHGGQVVLLHELYLRRSDLNRV